jgi:hypothetical protein
MCRYIFLKIPSTKFREKFNHWESRYCVGTDRQTDKYYTSLIGFFFYALVQQLAKVPSNVSLAILQSHSDDLDLYYRVLWRHVRDSCLPRISVLPSVNGDSSYCCDGEHRRPLRHRNSVQSIHSVAGRRCERRHINTARCQWKCAFRGWKNTYNKMEVPLHNTDINQVYASEVNLGS